MRVNQRVFTERIDMMDGIRVPNCPSEFREQAEKLVTMACGLGYQVGKYHRMSELQKILIVDYWITYDNLDEIIGRDGLSFRNWFVYTATQPELLRRAIQWLVAGNYFIVPENIRENALKASKHMAQSVKAKY